jgi:hypothetical protein
MERAASAAKQLMKLDWQELQDLMLSCGEAHALMCVAAGEDQSVHANKETMRTRIAEMSKEDVVRALAAFAVLGELVHEHHPEHGQH